MVLPSLLFLGGLISLVTFAYHVGRILRAARLRDLSAMFRDQDAFPPPEEREARAASDSTPPRGLKAVASDYRAAGYRVRTVREGDGFVADFTDDDRDEPKPSEAGAAA